MKLIVILLLKYQFILIITAVCSDFEWISQTFWIDVILKKFKQDSRLHQIIFFTNQPLTNKESRVIKQISTAIPTLTIDMEKLETDHDNRSLALPIFKNP